MELLDFAAAIPTTAAAAAIPTTAAAAAAAIPEYNNISDYFEILGSKLYCEWPEYPDNRWVFFGRQDESPLASSSRIGIPEKLTNRQGGVVKEKIMSALRNFRNEYFTEIIIQFWEPIMVSGRCCLTTSDQPFVLSNFHKGLCRYRRQSLEYIMDVDGEKSDEEIGLPGRVFRHKLPESTPNVRYYSSKEYPLQDLAVSCGVRTSFAFPLFEPSSGQSCVGVFEFVSTDQGLYDEIVHIYSAIEIWERQRDAAHEINEVLGIVCKKHKLPLAQAWAPYLHSSGEDNCDTIGNCCNRLDLSCNKRVITVIPNAYYSDGFMAWAFRLACSVNHLRDGQGHVGKALLSQKPCFCRDITQLNITEYSLAHYAIECELTGCFAICLLNTSTGDIDCVLELFLPPSNTENNGDPQTLLDSLVATMKQHFRSFTFAAGEQGVVEIIQSSMDDELDSLLNRFQITSDYPGPEALQAEREAVGDGLSVEVIQPFANELNSLIIRQTTNSCPRPEALKTEKEAMEADSSNQQSVILEGRDVVGAEQSNIYATCLDQTCKPKTSNRARKYCISYEEIKELQLSGVKIDIAAKSLGVHRSTFKRICREFGLEDWRASRKRKNVNHLLSNLKHATDSVQAGNERTSKSSSRDPSRSESPPKQTLPNVTPMQDVSTVTIKAKYKDDTIRFDLSFSSGREELVENITERLQLLKGKAFSIKYEDDEGEWILIACDKDLQECMSSSRSLPERRPVRLLIGLPINDEAL